MSKMERGTAFSAHLRATGVGRKQTRGKSMLVKIGLYARPPVSVKPDPRGGGSQ